MEVIIREINKALLTKNVSLEFIFTCNKHIHLLQVKRFLFTSILWCLLLFSSAFFFLHLFILLPFSSFTLLLVVYGDWYKEAAVMLHIGKKTKCDMATLKVVESDVSLDKNVTSKSYNKRPRGLDALLGYLLVKRIPVM